MMSLLIWCVCVCVRDVWVKVRFAPFGSLTSVASIDILHQPISVVSCITRAHAQFQTNKGFVCVCACMRVRVCTCFIVFSLDICLLKERGCQKADKTAHMNETRVVFVAYTCEFLLK